MILCYDPANPRPIFLTTPRDRPGGLVRVGIVGSLWWSPPSQSILVLQGVGAGYVTGMLFRGGLRLRLPVSRTLFEEQYRAVVLPLVGTYWMIPVPDHPLAGVEWGEVRLITSMRGLTLWYKTAQSRQVRERRRRRDVRSYTTMYNTRTMALAELLEQGTRLPAPIPGEPWTDPHGDTVRIVRKNRTLVTWRGSAGGTGRCCTHEFMQNFRSQALFPRQEAVREEPWVGRRPEPEPEPELTNRPTVWDRVSG